MNNFLKGPLERWYEDKGFGLIRPEQAKGDVFIHISALKNMTRRPVVGDIIYYQLHVGDDGKNKAINARIEGVAFVKIKSSRSNNQKSNQNRWSLISVTFLLFVAVGFLLYGKPIPYRQNESNDPSEFVSGKDSSQDLILKDAFLLRASHIQVEGDGIISRILSDDTEGGRRFWLHIT